MLRQGFGVLGWHCRCEDITDGCISGVMKGRGPSIRAKALSRHKTCAVFFSPLVVQSGVENRSSVTRTVNHATANRSANHRYDLTIGHDSSIRIPMFIGTRAPNQSFGLACAIQGRPRAAPDTSDLWIGCVRSLHPVESHDQFPCRRHFGDSSRSLVAAMYVLVAKFRIVAHHTLCRFHQQHAHEAVALLADGTKPLMPTRTVFSRDQPR
jgi:hypothetical protein